MVGLKLVQICENRLLMMKSTPFVLVTLGLFAEKSVLFIACSCSRQNQCFVHM